MIKSCVAELLNGPQEILSDIARTFQNKHSQKLLRRLFLGVNKRRFSLKENALLQQKIPPPPPSGIGRDLVIVIVVIYRYRLVFVIFMYLAGYMAVWGSHVGDSFMISFIYYYYLPISIL